MVKKIKCVNCGKEYSVKVIDKKGLCRDCRKVSDTAPLISTKIGRFKKWA